MNGVLYHGTSAVNEKKILQEGLTPRKYQKHRKWKDTVPPEFVYLTDTFPIFFTAYRAKTRTRDALIVEVDASKLNEYLLYPDDDFIWHIWRMKEPERVKNIQESLIEAGKCVLLNQSIWKESLQMLGTVAHYGPIPIESIQRILRIKYKEMGINSRTFVFGMGDTTIQPITVQILRPEKQQQIRWLFGDTEQPTTMPPISDTYAKQQQEIFQKMTENKMRWAEIIYQRKEGVE
jgi:hypothetical protein